MFFGQGSPEKAYTPPKKSAADQPHDIKPAQPSPNAPVGVAVDYLMSPVKAGSNTTITIKTTPKATCSISVTYNGVASTDSGLMPKKADAYGNISWTWTVGAGVPAGNWPVKVNCDYRAKSGRVQQDLQVTH
jgi:hypothetical protein